MDHAPPSTAHNQTRPNATPSRGPGLTRPPLTDPRQPRPEHQRLPPRVNPIVRRRSPRTRPEAALRRQSDAGASAGAEENAIVRSGQRGSSWARRRIWGGKSGSYFPTSGQARSVAGVPTSSNVSSKPRRVLARLVRRRHAGSPSVPRSSSNDRVASMPGSFGSSPSRCTWRCPTSNTSSELGRTASF